MDVWLNTITMRRMKLSKMFVTGCDYKTEWQLPWFLENYKKFNDTPVAVADFGMTPMMKGWLEDQKVGILESTAILDRGWFAKPTTMMLASEQAEYVCWIDTDCQVFGDISGIFNFVEPNKLAMVEDKPWTARRGEKWHNSGVVAFTGIPTILRKWVEHVNQNPEVGDQEVLHEIVKNDLNRLIHITDLPNTYNWLRIQILDGDDNPNKLVLHHTGKKGNEEIRRQIGV